MVVRRLVASLCGARQMRRCVMYSWLCHACLLMCFFVPRLSGAAHVCDSSPCNTGFCFRRGESFGDYECLCRAGISGTNCTEDINECDLTPSLCDVINGRCNNTNGTYQCTCNTGYTLHETTCKRDQMYTITGVSKSIGGSDPDDGEETFDIPAGLPFFGTIYRNITVSMNGLIYLGDSMNLETKVTDANPPASYPPNKKILAPFWTDLECKRGRGCRTNVKVFNKETTSENERGILRSLAEDVTSYAGVESYEPFSVVIVEWVNISPYPASQNPDENVSFKAVLTSDGLASYALFMYGENTITARPCAASQNPAGCRIILIGYSDGDQFQYNITHGGVLEDPFHPENRSNTDVPGVYFLELGDPVLVNDHLPCMEWYVKQPGNTTQVIESMYELLDCPCSEASALEDKRMERHYQSTTYESLSHCYLYNQTAENITATPLCCYEELSGALLTDSPWGSRILMNGDVESDDGYARCCNHSTTLCHIYLKLYTLPDKCDLYDPPPNATDFSYPKWKIVPNDIGFPSHILVSDGLNASTTISAAPSSQNITGEMEYRQKQFYFETPSLLRFKVFSLNESSPMPYSQDFGNFYSENETWTWEVTDDFKYRKLSVALTFVANDGAGMMSLIWPEIRICSCMDHQKCLFSYMNSLERPFSLEKFYYGECHCNNGYIRSGVMCIEDENICDPNPCHPGVECKNGTCGSCPDYMEDGDPKNPGRKCYVKNYCLNAGCCHECLSTPETEGFTCSCRDGYILDGDGKRCMDIDECRDLKICSGPGVFCENTQGSFTCQCNSKYYWDEGAASCLYSPEIFYGRFEYSGYYINSKYVSWGDDERDQSLAKQYLLPQIEDAFRSAYGDNYKHAELSKTILAGNDGSSIIATFKAYFTDTRSSNQGDSEGYMKIQDSLVNYFTTRGCTLNQTTDCLVGDILSVSISSVQIGPEVHSLCSSGMDNDCNSDTTLCNDTYGTYECRCKFGYTSWRGVRNLCIDIDECRSSQLNDCGNNSICSNTPGSYFCQCLSGYKSENVTDDCKEDPCWYNPCKNGGVCISSENSYTCECPDYWDGPLCQQKTGPNDYRSALVAVSCILALVILLMIILTVLYCVRSRSSEQSYSFTTDSVGNTYLGSNEVALETWTRDGVTATNSKNGEFQPGQKGPPAGGSDGVVNHSFE